MIDTVLFDMGGTLENLYYGPDTLRDAAQCILALLPPNNVRAGLGVEDVMRLADEGWQRYKTDFQKQCIELKPEEIWPNYILPGIVTNAKMLTMELCEELAHMWELTFYRRNMRPGVPEMLHELKEMGMRMGVVSNTASQFQVFEVLEQYGIREYFEDVTLSSVVRYRKPNPTIFKIALRQMRAKPENTAYVGDTISRDVVGPKRAGFALTFLIHSFLTASRDVERYDVAPDYIIEHIGEISALLRGHR